MTATKPTVACPTGGGAPTKNLSSQYSSFLENYDADGILDLRVQIDTPGIGATTSTSLLYLTGRFSESAGGACFESTASVRISGGS